MRSSGVLATVKLLFAAADDALNSSDLSGYIHRGVFLSRRETLATHEECCRTYCLQPAELRG